MARLTPGEAHDLFEFMSKKAYKTENFNFLIVVFMVEFYFVDPVILDPVFSCSALPGVAKPYFAFIANNSASFFSASTFLKALFDW